MELYSMWPIIHESSWFNHIREAIASARFLPWVSWRTQVHNPGALRGRYWWPRVLWTSVPHHIEMGKITKNYSQWCICPSEGLRECQTSRLCASQMPGQEEMLISSLTSHSLFKTQTISRNTHALLPFHSALVYGSSYLWGQNREG